MENQGPQIGSHVLYKERIYKVMGYDKANDIVEIRLSTGKSVNVFLSEVIRLTIEEENELVILAGVSHPNFHGNVIRMLLA
jgi:hypothetical protein